MITAFCAVFPDDKPVLLRSNGDGEGLVFLRLPNRIASEQKTGSICKNLGLFRPHFADFHISPLYKSGGIMNTANTDYPKSFFKPIEYNLLARIGRKVRFLRRTHEKLYVEE